MVQSKGQKYSGLWIFNNEFIQTQTARVFLLRIYRGRSFYMYVGTGDEAIVAPVLFSVRGNLCTRWDFGKEAPPEASVWSVMLQLRTSGCALASAFH